MQKIVLYNSTKKYLKECLTFTKKYKKLLFSGKKSYIFFETDPKICFFL